MHRNAATSGRVPLGPALNTAFMRVCTTPHSTMAALCCVRIDENRDGTSMLDSWLYFNTLFLLYFPMLFLSATWKLRSFWPTHPTPVGHLLSCTLFLGALFPMFHSPVYILAEFTSVSHKLARVLYFCCTRAWEDWSFSLQSHHCGPLLHAIQPCHC